MNTIAAIYLVIGFIVAMCFYRQESRKVEVIDVPIANITTMFVWILWPLALVVFAIRWVQIH